MSEKPADRVNEILTSLDSLRGRAADMLFPLVYDELHDLAERLFRDERANHTLQPTALIHEAYLRLVDQSQVNWQGRAHFFGAAARAMRRVLVDHARGRNRQKRGGGEAPVTLESVLIPAELPETDILALHEAIERLAALDPRQAQIVELRFFGGMSIDEIALALDVSKRTVEGDWTHAKVWLRHELDSGSPI
jgi:RNA polymerase sigma factor (TIGR02999 family)